MTDDTTEGTTDDAPLLTSIEGGVLLVRFNRPEALNALNDEAVALLHEAVAEASESDEVHALVLTGEGRGFCAGADVGGLAARGGGASRHQRMDRRGNSGELAEAFARCDVPIIAAVNGPAAGAGFGLALCCDLRFLGASARMGTVFIKRGLAATTRRHTGCRASSARGAPMSCSTAAICSARIAASSWASPTRSSPTTSCCRARSTTPAGSPPGRRSPTRACAAR